MAIEIRQLQKKYGSFVAVSNVDLFVPEGEMLVLLGPSGCGKTTTMRCIAGLETPDRGSISIGEREVFNADTGINIAINRRNVGMVFQSYAIWPHMTVYENVAFPLRMEKMDSATQRKRVFEILEIVGLQEFADRGASYLSGGQMQRVALARSLAMQPSVLLFDEPLSNLDARLRDHLRVELRELQTQFKITSVYVTHDQREALAIADKILVMDKGNILQIDDPITLYNNPKNRTVASLLGYSNIFEAEMTGTTDGGASVALKAGGDQLIADTTLLREANSDIVACVRPEDIEIDMSNASASADNVVSGTVLLSSFMGTQMQYRVRTSSGTVWDILSSRIGRDIAINTPVTLRIPQSAVKLLSAA